MITNLYNFILNLIFISIPQILLSIIVILFLLKEYSYFKSKNFKSTVLDSLMVGTLMSSVGVTYLIHFTNLTLLPRLILNSIILFIFTIHLIQWTLERKIRKEYLKEVYSPNSKIYTPKEMDEFRRETSRYIFFIKNGISKLRYKRTLKTYLYSALSILFIVTIEMVTSLYLNYVFALDMATINTNILNSILIVYPNLMIYAFIVYLCYVYVNTGNVTLFKIWKHNKKFRILTYVQAATTSVFTIIVYNLALNYNIFLILKPDTSFKISLILFTLLVLHVIIPWTLICRKELLKYRLIKTQEIDL